MTGFTADPDSFPPSAQQLRAAAEQLVQAWQPVAQQSMAVKFGRGDDIVSPLVKMSLQSGTQLVDSCIQTSAQALAGYADGLEAMGKLYAGVETDTTAMLGGTK